MGETEAPATADWPTMLTRPRAVQYRQDIVSLASAACAAGAAEARTFLDNLGLCGAGHLYLHQALEVDDSPAYVSRAAAHESRWFANHRLNRGQYDNWAGAF